MFAANNIVTNIDKGQWIYSGYGIAFDRTGSWVFGNELATNVIFGVVNSLSTHAENRKNNFLLSAGQKFSINFSEENAKCCMSLHYSHDNSYSFVNGKEIYKFKAEKKNVDFPARFFLGSKSKRFGRVDSRDIPLKGSVYGFSVDYNAIDKSATWNIHKCLMVNNSIK